MSAATIASQEAQWDTTNTVQPYLVQTDEAEGIPDYWNDERYDPTWTWAKANEPRYGNEESWMESSPDGYKEPNIMSAATIAATKA
jgi:hypothetical protein